MADYGIAYLRRKLAQKRLRVRERYEYYDMKNRLRDFHISTPPQLKYFQSSIRWCACAVDALAMRLRFRDFANDFFGLNEIYAMNNRDILFRSAVFSALIGSCSFLYISADETGYPRLQVIDGGSATGILDLVTGLLTEGYAVLDWLQPGGVGEAHDGIRGGRGEGHDGIWGGVGEGHDGIPGGIPFREAYFRRDYTFILENGKQIMAVPNQAAYPLLVPVIFAPTADRPFGHSRISRACMALTDAALRTLKRSEISAEYYSFPQKYILGLEPGAEFVGTGPSGPQAAGSSGLYGAGQYGGQYTGQYGQYSGQYEGLRQYGGQGVSCSGQGGSCGGQSIGQSGLTSGTGDTGGLTSSADGGRQNMPPASTISANGGQNMPPAGIHPDDRWRMSMASMLCIGSGDGQQLPKVGQFTQQSMEPHASMLKTLAGQFAQTSGLTLDDMGFPTDNPSSAEAIKSAHENLRLTALDAQTTFGTGFLNAGYLAACVRDGFPYTRQQLSKTIPKWEPIFPPDSAMLAGIGDAVGKINTAVPGYFTAENLWDITGIAPTG